MASTVSMTSWLGFIVLSSASLNVSQAIEIPANISADLRSPEFRKREIALSQLQAWARLRPQQAIEELYRQTRFAEDPEMRVRCTSALKDLVLIAYEDDGKGYLGISMRGELALFPGTPKPSGMVRVNQVMAGSAAERAGLKVQDLIAALNGEFWPDGNAVEDFAKSVRQMKAKTKIHLKILRNGKPIDLDAILGKRPPSMDAAQQNNPGFDAEALERADKEAYFRRWLDSQKREK